MELFTTRAYDEITMDEICEAAGVASHGLINYHFNGKRGLYLEAVSQLADDFVAYPRAIRSREPVDARLREYVHYHFEFTQSHPHGFLAIMSARHADTDVQGIVDRARTAALNDLVEILDIGSEPSPRQKIALRGWFGYVNAITLDWLDHQDDMAIDEISELCVRILVQSVCVLSPPPRR